LLKEGQNLADISKALGVSREQVRGSYKKKTVAGNRGVCGAGEKWPG